MKNILTFMLILALCGRSFAISLLQTPPPPAPYMDEGEPEVPINFIVPFLLISIVSILFFFIVKKNKLKTR